MNVPENVQRSLMCSEERRKNGTREEKEDAILSVTRVEPVLGGRSCRDHAAVVQVEPDVTLLRMKHRSILRVTLLVMVHGAIKRPPAGWSKASFLRCTKATLLSY